MITFDKPPSQYISEITRSNFSKFALEVFQYQYANNDIYREFVRAIGVAAEEVDELCRIPFLPVSFFRSHRVVSGKAPSVMAFQSSGTAGEKQSIHHIVRPALYRESLLKGFKSFYGNPTDYVFLAVLPSYLERKNASLVYMAETLMQESSQPENGFYLHDYDRLKQQLVHLQADGQKTILLGVTFALLDFARAYPMDLHDIVVMETGGMKGRAKEQTRNEVHEFLSKQWKLTSVHSEYGMTELLSQAYAKKDGLFYAPDTMRVLVRDVNDPLDVSFHGQGCLNIIDLANLDSCSFLATDDVGIVHANGSFEVLGRMDFAALRGCSLMVA